MRTVILLGTLACCLLAVRPSVATEPGPDPEFGLVLAQWVARIRLFLPRSRRTRSIRCIPRANHDAGACPSQITPSSLADNCSGGCYAADSVASEDLRVGGTELPRRLAERLAGGAVDSRTRTSAFRTKRFRSPLSKC